VSPEPSADAPDGAGAVGEDGDAPTLVFRRQFRHPLERVWAAITEPDQIRRWQLTEATIDARPGGSVEFVTGPDRVRSFGRIRAWRPPRLWEYEWNFAPGPYVPDGESAVVRWELSPTPDGTLLVLTHRRLSRPTARAFARGLRGFLDRLGAQLDGTPLPDWPPPSGAGPPVRTA
jgi:uncharacterized protein YndB with AHSA1/START domain